MRNVTIKIEDHQEINARYGAYIVDLIQQYLDHSPSVLTRFEQRGACILPSLRVVVRTANAAFEEPSVRDVFVPRQVYARVKPMHVVGLIASLLLWGIIFMIFRALF